MAVALGALEFAIRAIIRTNSNWVCDLVPPYVSARLWLAGINPYDTSISLKTWYASGASLADSGMAFSVGSVYPPPTLLLMVPLATLRWHPAFYLFMATGLLLYAAVVYMLVRLGWPEHQSLSSLLHDTKATLFLAFCLGFAPVHTAFHSVNIVLVACCAAILALLITAKSTAPLNKLTRASRSGSLPGILAGAGVAAAILIKPTTGIFLLPWLVRERRWRCLIGVIVACTVVTALSLAPMLAHQGLTWLPTYRQNVTALFTHGGNADVSAENPENTDRIDLQMIAFAALGDRTLASAAAAAVYLCLMAAFLRRAGWRKRSELASDSLGLPMLIAAGCLTLGLLPSYSRMYSAIVLLPLVLWCFRHLHLRSARWLMLLLLDFLVNTSALVRICGQKAGLISHSPRLWDLTIGGHTCWLLLAIGCLLVYAVYQQTADDELRSVPISPATS